ncbi:hypothetical protein [Candidatus Villigracilis saccharophilus]|uniref:hypothetical protein n=1 Tax=Candidatus Villigracilis saccharophilus TaxID=3140684 RepID=UPI0031350EB0|nr:hypothetical protein [Anaerolineales bacterium]
MACENSAVRALRVSDGSLLASRRMWYLTMVSATTSEQGMLNPRRAMGSHSSAVMPPMGELSKYP